MARGLTYLSPALVNEIVSNRPLVTGPQVAIGLCLLFVLLFFSESGNAGHDAAARVAHAV